jgi:hypothetical protein
MTPEKFCKLELVNTKKKNELEELSNLEVMNTNLEEICLLTNSLT